MYDDQFDEFDGKSLCILCGDIAEFGSNFCLLCEQEIWDDIHEDDCVDDKPW